MTCTFYKYTFVLEHPVSSLTFIPLFKTHSETPLLILLSYFHHAPPCASSSIAPMKTKIEKENELSKVLTFFVPSVNDIGSMENKIREGSKCVRACKGTRLFFEWRKTSPQNFHFLVTAGQVNNQILFYFNFAMTPLSTLALNTRKSHWKLMGFFFVY